MGWSGIFTVLRNASEKKEFCRNLLCVPIVKDALVGNHYWAAVKRDDNDTVSVIEIMLRKGVHAGEILYKSVPETYGPVDCDCPMSLIRICSEPENTYAAQWRYRAEQHAADTKTLRKRLLQMKEAPLGTSITFFAPFDAKAGSVRFSKGDTLSANKLYYKNGTAWVTYGCKWSVSALAKADWLGFDKPNKQTASV